MREEAQWELQAISKDAISRRGPGASFAPCWPIKGAQSGRPHSLPGSLITTQGTEGCTILCGIRTPGHHPGRRSMALKTWLLCLLLLGLVLPGASSRAHQHSMETRTPDINPAWYTGRGIRPVGRFGRRRATPRDVTGPGQLSCLPLDGRTKFSQRG